MTTAEELETCRKASKQNNIEKPSAQIGIPCLVHREKILGAWPSRDMPCSVRAAVYRIALPALKIDVMIMALTKLGSPEVLSRFIAMT